MSASVTPTLGVKELNLIQMALVTLESWIQFKKEEDVAGADAAFIADVEQQVHDLRTKLGIPDDGLIIKDICQTVQ